MKGLTTNFYLIEGKFSLSEGAPKVDNAIWFYGIFNKFRVYASDFGADFVSLVQKPVGTLIINKAIILGNLRRGLQKYVPNTVIRKIDIGYSGNDRTNFSMVIEYSSVIENTTIQGVTFV